MSRLNRYLKIARETVVEPGDDIEDKIIKRIDHIEEKDRRLLDESFLDFFKKQNSLSYLIGRKLRDRPGILTIMVLFIIALTAAAVFVLRSKKGSKSSA